jgi:hypothetical protein
MSRDRARSYECIDELDLARLGRLASAAADEFFDCKPKRAMWRGRLRFTALCQGGAEHYLRGVRGISDLDLTLFFAQHPDDKPRPYLRRLPRCWDWGPSKFGRCPFDPPVYEGRAVDVMLWVIPDRKDPIDGLIEWLTRRRAEKPDAIETPDLAHEPVVLIEPSFGEVVWDPPNVPRPRLRKAPHRPPLRKAPW